jgi:hypothetical protein
MRLYPATPDARTRTIARDAITLLVLLLFAWLAVQVHDAVDELAVLGSGVRESGTLVEEGFRQAGDAVAGVPVVGDQVAEGLRGAGAGTGGEVAEAGQAGEERVHDLANLLGLVTFGLPAAVLLALTLPRRVRQVRTLNAAARLLGDPASPERRRLIAQRAALSLPAELLLEHSDDPLGDLAAGRLDALVEAAFAHAGLAAPRRPLRRGEARA